MNRNGEAEVRSVGRAQAQVANDDDDDIDVHRDQHQQNASVEGGRQIPLKMKMDDPRRNWLTPEERERAIDFKELADSMPDLDQMTDFMLAQYAVALPGDVVDKVERAYALQQFKEEYEILDTYEEGCRILDTLFELMPEQFLGFSFSDDEGTYVFAHDATKLDSNNLDTPNKALDWIKACFYVHTTFCPDMDSIRKGIVVLSECEGWDWTKKQDSKLFQRLFSELLTVYPFRGQVRHYHTGLVLNVVASMLRQILPQHLRDSFIVGLKFQERLDKFFLLPDAKTARQRMLARMKSTLKRRYDHEKTFSLDNC